MFDKYFEIVLADTQEAREIHYNIRYQVYCEELGYENTDKFPNQQEFDKWDPQDDNDHSSVPFLVRLKHTGQWIGAMRLVHYNGHALPLEETSSLDQAINSPAIEISRLCMIKEIRNPHLGNSYGINENDINDEHISNEEDSEQIELFYSNPKVKGTIIWGLFNAALQYSRDNNIKKWYLLTTKALTRIIKRQGFNIEQVGPTCEHRGKRSPYRFDVNEIIDNPIWDSFNNRYRLYSEILPQQVEVTAKAA